MVQKSMANLRTVLRFDRSMLVTFALKWIVGTLLQPLQTKIQNAALALAPFALPLVAWLVVPSVLIIAVVVGLAMAYRSCWLPAAADLRVSRRRRKKRNHRKLRRER